MLAPAVCKMARCVWLHHTNRKAPTADVLIHSAASRFLAPYQKPTRPYDSTVRKLKKSHTSVAMQEAYAGTKTAAVVSSSSSSDSSAEASLEAQAMAAQAKAFRALAPLRNQVQAQRAKRARATKQFLAELPAAKAARVQTGPVNVLLL